MLRPVSLEQSGVGNENIQVATDKEAEGILLTQFTEHEFRGFNIEHCQTERRWMVGWLVGWLGKGREG